MKETTCSDNELHDLIVPTVEEQYNEDDHYGTFRPADEKPYDGCEGQWAGDGSGFEDFQDYNQNEGWDW